MPGIKPELTVSPTKNGLLEATPPALQSEIDCGAACVQMAHPFLLQLTA